MNHCNTVNTRKKDGGRNATAEQRTEPLRILAEACPARAPPSPPPRSAARAGAAAPSAPTAAARRPPPSRRQHSGTDPRKALAQGNWEWRNAVGKTLPDSKRFSRTIRTLGRVRIFGPGASLVPARRGLRKLLGQIARARRCAPSSVPVNNLRVAHAGGHRVWVALACVFVVFQEYSWYHTNVLALYIRCFTRALRMLRPSLLWNFHARLALWAKHLHCEAPTNGAHAGGHAEARGWGKDARRIRVVWLEFERATLKGRTQPFSQG